MPAQPQTNRTKTVLDDLPFCVARAAISFRRMNDQALRAVGLPPQAPGIGSVMHALFEGDHCTVKNLAARTQLPNATLTWVLDRLERDGFVRRLDNVEDRRSWRVQLSPKGRRAGRQLLLRHESILQFFEGVLSPAEAGQLKRLLGRLTEAMRAETTQTEKTIQTAIRVANRRPAKPVRQPEIP